MNIFLTPPVVFIVLLVFSIGVSGISNIFAFKGKDSAGKFKAYACGEDVPLHNSRPDYSEFFPLAYFFTIMHVVVLIIATDPPGFSIMPILYIIISALALFILFRK